MKCRVIWFLSNSSQTGDDKLQMIWGGRGGASLSAESDILQLATVSLRHMKYIMKDLNQIYKDLL